MNNVKYFDPNLLSIDKISFKSIDVVAYHIKYITMKSLANENIDSENPLHFVFNDVDGYIIEKIVYKCFIFASTKNNQEVLAKYTKLWD